MKTKRLFLLLVALVALVMAVAACGDDDEDEASDSAAAVATSAAEAVDSAVTSAAEVQSSVEEQVDSAVSSATEEASSAEEEAVSSEEAVESTAAATTPIKIGLVTDVGGLNDKGFNQLANEGLQRAAAELGSEVEVRESKAPTDYVPNLSYFAQQGYDLVVAVGFLMGKDLGLVAQQYPDTKFAIVDFSATAEEIAGAKNVAGLLFKEQEAGYLAGYLVGLLYKQGGFKGLNDKNTISSVGGIKIPPVDKFIAGYQFGAEQANPGMTFLNGYSNDFVDQAKCKELAASQISQGSAVVFQVAGQCGLGALEAAGEAGVWGIGVDNDQADEGPHVLTSAVKKVDEAVFAVASQVVDGSYVGGEDIIFGVAENGVGLGTISPDVPADIVGEIDAQIEAVKAGSLEIPTEVP